MTRERQERERYGRRAETLAAWWLRLKGYRILARRMRTPAGEVDIVATRGGMLVLVEVKARARLEDCAQALGARQIFRLRGAALWLMGQRIGVNARSGVRIDALWVAPGRWPRHLVNVAADTIGGR